MPVTPRLQRAPLDAALPDPLERFVADVESLRGTHTSDRQLASAVAE